MIRVGLIGAGFIGRNHFNQYEKMANRVAVVALCDKQADRRAGDWSNVGGNLGDARGSRRDLAGITPYTDYRELLDDPGIDMVDICVPTALHPQITIDALNAGKHVLCEKPMALTVSDCDRMMAAAEASTAKLMVAQCIRFWPEYVYLKQCLEQNRFGVLKSLHLRREAGTPDYTLNNWATDPAQSGGAILDLHVHDVDFALWMLGQPVSVSARGYQRENGAVDRVQARWNYGSDQMVEIDGCWDLPPEFGFNMGFTAVFERASIVWDMAAPWALGVWHPDGQQDRPELTGQGDEAYFGEIDYFLNCVEEGRPPEITTPAESRNAVRMALAEKESILSKKPVRLC